MPVCDIYTDLNIGLYEMTLEPEIKIIQSPCIRNCCLDDEDVCLGCFRTIHEITGWNASSAEEKQAVLERCSLRKQNRSSLFSS